MTKALAVAVEARTEEEPMKRTVNGTRNNEDDKQTKILTHLCPVAAPAAAVVTIQTPLLLEGKRKHDKAD